MKQFTDLLPTRLLAVAIFLLMICTFVLNNGVLPPNIMEARNLTTAREMVTDHNWTKPTLNGEVRLEKPPLPTWIAAGTMLLFGQDNLSILRLPSAIAAMLLVLFLMLLTKELTDDKLLPWLVAGTASTSFYLFFMARDISWDIFCHSFMMGAIWLFHKGLKNNKHALLLFAGSASLAGLSFYSKGPVAFYALLLPYFIALFFTRKIHPFSFNPFGLLTWGIITFLISSTWPIYIYLTQPDHSTIVALQETSSWINRNVKPFYHYWSFTAQSGIWIVPATLSLIVPLIKGQKNSYGKHLLPIIWTFASLLLLSLVPEKKERYLLPVLIPLAITTAVFFGNLLNQVKEGKSGKLESWFIKGYGFLITVVALVIPVIFALLLMKSDFKPNILAIVGAFLFFWATAILLFKAVRKQDPLLLWLGLVLTVASTTSILFGSAQAVILKNSSYRPYTELRHHPKLESLPFYYAGKGDVKLIEVVWAIGRKITAQKDSINKQLPDKAAFVLLSPNQPEETYPKELLQEYQLESIGLFDANLQKRWGGAELRNWVTIFRKRSTK